jgi:hypothetical protein
VSAAMLAYGWSRDRLGLGSLAGMTPELSAAVPRGLNGGG